MLRISQQLRAETTVVRLEGDLKAAWVPELRSVCEAPELNATPVELDLSELRFVDQAGETLLRELLSGGVRLGPCSTYVGELLKGDRT